MWQEVKVIYLPKVGRIGDKTPKAYRPISLMSFPLKTLERLIDRYIRDEVLQTSPLNERQYAYQPGKSTDLALDDLNRLLTKSLEDKEIAMTTFIDIEGAFNNASTESIANALVKKGVPLLLCQWINANLKNRVITSAIGGITLTARANRGCPQGGVLSPLLWAILMDELIERLSSRGFHCLGYADDLAIIAKGKFARTVSELTQSALDIIDRWCKEEELTVNPHKTTIVTYTRKKVLEGLRSPVLNGIEIPFAQEAKYLGVIFDHKLTWNQHLQKVIEKSTVAFNLCRRMCGKNWGLQPKMTTWLYARVIRPMIAYGSVVWWPKTEQVGVVRRLGGLQRQACLSATGAMRTTPTAALEVLLNLPPLHIYIQGEARSVTSRLLRGQAPISNMHGRDYNRLYEELENDPVTRMPSDGILPRYSFDKTYRTSITDRDAWKEGPPIKAEIAVYTDGSKTDEGSGAGIYGTRPKMKISMSLGKQATIFQAEIVAIHHCAQELIRHEFSEKTIVIYSDSQAAIKAVNSMQVTSKLVWDCIEALKELGSQNRLTLAWVPAHTGYRGNEEADTLAREGASKALIGPEPFCGIAKAVLKTNTKSWIQQKSQEWWNNSPGMRQAKEFIKQPQPTFTEYLLSQRRNTTRILVGLLTGHCRLNKHMSTIGLAEEMLCRFCQEEEETSAHILCHCEGLSRLRFLTLGEEKPRAPRFMGVLKTSLWSLVTKTGLDKEL